MVALAQGLPECALVGVKGLRGMEARISLEELATVGHNLGILIQEWYEITIGMAR